MREDVSATEKAEALDEMLRHATPPEVIEGALRAVGRERLAVVSSFGTESAALLKVMADVDPAIPVIFLDTGWLFEETLAYRDTLIARLGLRDVRTIAPSCPVSIAAFLRASLSARPADRPATALEWQAALSRLRAEAATG